MISALLDANVLYPAPIRDLLLSLAEEELYKPFWTTKIQEEWKRNLLINRPDLDPERIDRTIRLMEQAFPEAIVENYEDCIPQVPIKDPGDKHVIAAAIKANAHYLITINLKDFKTPILKSAKIKVMHPDEFVSKLIVLNQEGVINSIERLISRLKNPPLKKEEILNTLNNCGLKETVKKLRQIQH